MGPTAPHGSPSPALLSDTGCAFGRCGAGLRDPREPHGFGVFPDPTILQRRYFDGETLAAALSNALTNKPGRDRSRRQRYREEATAPHRPTSPGRSPHRTAPPPIKGGGRGLRQRWAGERRGRGFESRGGTLSSGRSEDLEGPGGGCFRGGEQGGG